MKVLKGILLIGLVLCIGGAIAFFISFAASGWNIQALSSTTVKESTYIESSDNKINTVSIDYDNADVLISFGDVSELTVVYPELFTKGGKPAAKVNVSDLGGELSIKSEQIWNRTIGFNFADEVVKITVPYDAAYDFDISLDNGDVSIRADKEALVGTLKIETDNGDVDAERATIRTGGSIMIETDNGDIDLGTVYAESLTLNTDNGEVDIKGGEVKSTVTIETDNGDVELNGKITANRFTVETDNGEISLGDGIVDAAFINLTSDNGDIEAKLAGNRLDYDISVECGFGSSNISNNTAGVEKSLYVECDIGDIEIHFEE